MSDPTDAGVLLPALPLPALLVRATPPSGPADPGADTPGSGVWVVDGNAAAAALLGPADRFLGVAFRDAIHDPDSAIALDRVVAEASGQAAPVGGTSGGDAVLVRWGDGTPPLVLEVHRGGEVVGGHEPEMSGTATRDRRPVLLVLVDRTEEYRLDAILTAFDNAVYATDRDRRVTWVSKGLLDAYGPVFALGDDALGRVHPEDLPGALELTEDALASPRRKVRSSVRAAPDGLPRLWWRLDSVTMNLLDDPAVGALVTAFGPHADSADGPVDTNVMRISDVTPVGIVQSRADGLCYYRNRLATHHLGGITVGDEAAAWIDRLREEDQEPARLALKAAVAGHRSDPVEVGRPGPLGTAWYRIEFVPQFDGAGEANGWIATSLDVTAEVEARDELARAQQHLWHLANHDALTGLPNRPAIIDRLDHALEMGRRTGSGVALLYGDLDGFKAVNDRHGHLAGDHVLRVVAERLREAVRSSDTAGRLGGDEFVVVCEEVSGADDVVALAERIESAVLESIALPDGPVVGVGISLGVAVATAGESADELVARCDRAMYAAKARDAGSIVVD